MANLIEIFTKVHYAYIFIELLPRQQQQNIYTKLLSLFASIGFWTHNVEMWSEVLWKLQQHPHAHTHTHIDINALVRHWWAFGSHCKLNNTHTPCGRLLFIELVAFELNARESEGVGMAIMQCPIQIWIVRRPRSQRVQIKF